jgi:DNA-binding NtrC family response regulator
VERYLRNKEVEKIMDPPKILAFNPVKGLHDRLKSIIPDIDLESLEINAANNIALLMHEKQPDLVITCSMENDIQNSLYIVKKIRSFNQKIPILFIVGQSSEQLAIDAFRAGVSDYLKIPFSVNSLRKSIHLFLKNNVNLDESPPQLTESDIRIIGNSSSIKEIKEFIKRIALTDSTVLITGETGTGKELAAEMIHFFSKRRNKPFVRVNCSALPENLVESELFGYEKGAFTGATTSQKGKIMAANGGDVFFDEIGDMSLYAQAKILLSIENKEVFPLGSDHAVPLDFRIIAATNRHPEELVAEGKFRKDLYYRLNVARVQMPPLRERMEDLPELVEFAIKNFNQKFEQNIQGITDDAKELLFAYDWPGNVRELMNLIEAAFINLPKKTISHADLPKIFQKHFYTSKKIPLDEKRKILSALFENKWNKSSTAQKLNWSRMTLYRKMNKYNIVDQDKQFH